MRTYTFNATQANVTQFRQGDSLVFPLNLPHTENRNTRVRVKYMAVRAGVNYNGACFALKCLTPSMNAYAFDASHPAMICTGTQASAQTAEVGAAALGVRNFGFAENGTWIEFASVLQTIEVQLWVDNGAAAEDIEHLYAATDSDDLLRMALVFEVETF